MASNLGFRVGLLLDQFFSDRRKKCYFFVNTDKIQSILELKETLINKFALPSNVQLMHNGFLLLDEDTVFVVRQDEAIEVVAFSPNKKKSAHKHRSKYKNLDFISEDQFDKSDNMNTKSEEKPSVNVRNDKILNSFKNSVQDTSPAKKKKKRKEDKIIENSPSLDITPYDIGGIKFHSSPYNYVSDSAKNTAAATFCSYICEPVQNFEENVVMQQATHGNSETESSAPKKVDFQLDIESKEKEDVESSRSLKRKWKNEQNKLKYSGVAEILKHIQNSSENRSVEKQVEMDDATTQPDAELDDSSGCPKTRRKRVRRRKKKNKLDDRISMNLTHSSTFESTLPVEDAIQKFRSKERIHKRFGSIEDVSSNLEIHGDVFKTTNNEVLEESNLHLKLCSQISPLTPPSEHNSEDDVYKKLMDLKKLNKPVVFERMQVGKVSNIDGEEKDSVNASKRVDIDSHSCGKIEPDFEPMELVDQVYFSDPRAKIKTISEFEAPSNVPRSSNNSDKDDALSGAENRKNDNNSSKKDVCPVHIRNNICDINLDKIDINNYPVIESTRENDILVFKTLKLSANLTPSISSFILARVLEVTGNNLILFEILSGKEELDFSKDESTNKENKTLNPLIRLQWIDLYEPRLLYP